MLGIHYLPNALRYYLPMSFGLEVWNPSGEKVLSVTDRLFRIVQQGVVTYPSSPSSGTITVPVPGMANNGRWFVVLDGVYEGSQSAVIGSGSFSFFYAAYHFKNSRSYTVFTL